MKLYCEHVIRMSAGDFWSIIHRPDYEAKIAELLPLNEMTTIERREDDTEIFRRLHVVPPIPAAMEKLLSKLPGHIDPSYEERQWRSKKSMVVRWEMTPAMMGGKASLAGTVAVRPKGNKECIRILEGDVTIKLLGIGKIFEKAIISQTIESYGKTAAITNQVGATLLKK